MAVFNISREDGAWRLPFGTKPETHGNKVSLK